MAITICFNGILYVMALTIDNPYLLYVFSFTPAGLPFVFSGAALGGEVDQAWDRGVRN